MFGNARRIFTVRDVDVSVDLSWLVIMGLVTWSLWSRLQVLHGHGTALALGLALLGAVLFFASVLLHELAHALEGRHRGAHIRGITLFLFGGVTRSRMDVDGPGDEFVFAAVGPYASLVTAGAVGLLVTAMNAHTPPLRPVADVLGIVGWVNLGLAVFNLLPGAPLDGGRILRAGIWKVTGDRHTAIRLAGRVGQGLGTLMVATGLLQLFATTAGSLNGLWFAFIGWFLFGAASREVAMAQLKEALSDRPVRAVVAAPPAAVPVEATAHEAGRVLTRTDTDVLPVRDDTGVVGTVSLEQITATASGQRHATAVADVMTPRDELMEIAADEPAGEAVDAAATGESVLVVDPDGRPVGLLTRQRLATALQRMQSLGSVGSPSQSPPVHDGGETWIPRDSEATEAS